MSEGYTATPFLKWAGGKGQLLAQIESFFPRKFDSYLEPFVGGGAVFFYLRRTRGDFPATLMDSNLDLINCYGVVRDRVEQLIRILGAHRDKHCEKYYYSLRNDIRPEDITSVERAARFIYLNKTCYNGLYRVNRNGKFNVPVGSYKKPAVLDETNLRAASRALRGVQLSCADFSETRDHAGRNDFIYFDPPYYLRRLGFTSYAVHQFGGPLGGADFGADEHDRLMRVARRLVSQGCHVVISNSDAPYVRTLYKNFEIHSVMARRYINCDGDRRSPVEEIVITD